MTTESSSAFEAAVDVLAQLIGHGQQLLAEPPAEVDVERWRVRVDRWVEQRRSLEPGDSEAIRLVLEQDAPFLRSIVEAFDERGR